MRFKALLVYVGLVGLGLGAPASVPYQVVTTEDGIPLVRSRVIWVDVEASGAAFEKPNWPFSTRLITDKLSQYAAQVYELFRSVEDNLSVLPVFMPSDADSIEAMADSEGDIVNIGHEGPTGTWTWTQSSSFASCHMALLHRYLPLLFIAIYSALVIALMLLERVEELASNEYDLAIAEKGLGSTPREAASRIEEKGCV